MTKEVHRSGARPDSLYMPLKNRLTQEKFVVSPMTRHTPPWHHKPDLKTPTPPSLTPLSCISPIRGRCSASGWASDHRSHREGLPHNDIDRPSPSLRATSGMPWSPMLSTPKGAPPLQSVLGGVDSEIFAWPGKGGFDGPPSGEPPTVLGRGRTSC